MPRLANILVEGVSVGGLETCIDCPEWKLAFDVGRCPDVAVNRPTILFTHAHMDHMGGVAWHAATRHLRRMGPPTYLVPHENQQAFAELFEVWRRLDRSDLEHNRVAIGPGEALFVPVMAPHFVRTGPAPSVSLSITWRSEWSYRESDARTLNGILRAKGFAPKAPGRFPHQNYAKAYAYRVMRKLGLTGA